MRENTITLKDGRKLSYAEFGDPKGPVIIYFHGTPGARNHPIALAIEGVAPFVRFIMVERPGYGLSDSNDGRTLEDWNNDFEEFVNQLDIPHFCLAAASGGAPFALANCYFMPERIKRAAIICGVGPLAVEELLEKMGDTEKAWIKDSMHNPGQIIGNVAKIHADPHGYVQGIFNSLQEENQKMMSPAVVEAFLNLAFESSKSPYGMIDDGRTFLSEWNIPFEEISVPIQFWHGDQDSNVPISHSEYVSSRIPHSNLIRMD
ncbi:MAG: alpha/beta hydrolase [Bacillota bacterium]|nr:alpha/beta hydrolase [Bacillota bacterium]